MWEGYRSPGCWDELILDGCPRQACEGVVRYLVSLGDELTARQEAAELAVRSMGITFTVYTEAANIDQAWPFDVIRRVISTQEWAQISLGLVQRLTALNLFIADLYGAARVVTDGVFPAELLSSSVNFRPQCQGARPPQGVWAHICGSDLVRDVDGTMYVLGGVVELRRALPAAPRRPRPGVPVGPGADRARAPRLSTAPRLLREPGRLFCRARAARPAHRHRREHSRRQAACHRPLGAAWPSVFVPDAGWVDFDPTNDCLVSDRYITNAYGRDYGDVSPLKGVIYTESKGHGLHVSVDVAPVDVAPVERLS